MRLIGLAVAFTLALAPLAAEAQQMQKQKVAKIGFLLGGTASSPAVQIEPFKQTLREKGWIEGQNLTLEYRSANGAYERLPALAADLVGRRVDAIVTDGTPQTQAAQQATKTIPIVMATTGDPVASGLVATLARPGGNTTGASYFVPELNAKRLEILKEAAPEVKRVAVLYNPRNRMDELALEAIEAAAKPLKIRIQRLAVRTPADVEATNSRRWPPLTIGISKTTRRERRGSRPEWKDVCSTAANQFRSAQATLRARGHSHEPGVQCCERSSRSTRRPHQLQGRGYRDQQGTNGERGQGHRKSGHFGRDREHRPATGRCVFVVRIAEVGRRREEADR
jgi:hypothetical protein